MTKDGVKKNYIPGSVGFMPDRSLFNHMGFMMCADWKVAKKIIKDKIKEGRDIERVEMGLDGDWAYNSMVVWEDNEFTEYNCWQSSDWAPPMVIIYYKDGRSEAFPVWNREELED